MHPEGDSHQPVSRPISQPVGQSVSQSTSQSVGQSVSQSVSQSADRAAGRKLGLRQRLLISQLTVMAVTAIALATVSRLYTPRYFVITLERMERQGIRFQKVVQGRLVDGLTETWTRGMSWSVVLGGSTAGALSYWLSRRIAKPLLSMEQITRQFAAGDLSARVPPLDIPEFDHLGRSFNRMADDIEGVESRRRELVGDLTHELRTPLTIVKGYLEGLADGTIEPSEEIYGRLVRETERLQRLVNDLQELSKLEAGYLPVEIKEVAIAPLIKQVCDRFSDQLIASEDLALTSSLPDDLPAVWGDPARIEQVLVNLLSNALRHTKKGEVGVRVYTESGWVWVAVSDTGTGISEADLPHVFERFWRADRSRDRASGGSGIGLAVSRRLVELQGGRIEAESLLGKGSVFRFSLPTQPIR